MVNVGRGNPLSQGDIYLQRESWLRNDRQCIDPTRFEPVFSHELPQDIESALRDCARIPVKEFALFVKAENGEERMYSSPSLRPHRNRIFSSGFRREFRHCCRLISADGSFSSSGYPSTDAVYDRSAVADGPGFRKFSNGGDSSSDYTHENRPHQLKFEGSSDSIGGRRRKRTRYYPEDESESPGVQKFQLLKIGDEAEVKKFYETRFKDLQQSACKVIGKAFVKFVEPKKQTHHPYTGKNDKAPKWWPCMTGNNAVRHIEPDHLLKPERVNLLVHILRMIVEPPEKQHESVLKLGLNVKKLELVTNEMMSIWFNDKEHRDNKDKRPFLKEIFKVARAEERYKNGELDGTATVPVMHGDRVPGSGSDDEDEDGDLTEEDDGNAHLASDIQSPSESPASSTTVQGDQNSHFDQQSQSMAQQRNRALMGRHMSAGQMEEQAGYNVETLRMAPYPQQSSNLREYRGPFAPDFHTSPQNMYSSGWQNPSLMNNSPMSTSNYCLTSLTSSSQSSLAAPTAPFQLPAPNVQYPHMLPPPPYCEGLPGSAQFDSRPALGHQLRTGSLGHPHQTHHGQPFPEYLQDGAGFGHNDTGMKEEESRQC